MNQREELLLELECLVEARAMRAVKLRLKPAGDLGYAAAYRHELSELSSVLFRLMEDQRLDRKVTGAAVTTESFTEQARKTRRTSQNEKD